MTLPRALLLAYAASLTVLALLAAHDRHLRAIQGGPLARWWVLAAYVVLLAAAWPVAVPLAWLAGRCETPDVQPPKTPPRAIHGPATGHGKGRGVV